MTALDTARAERSFWALSRRIRIWLLAGFAVLLVSTIPHLGAMAETLRLLAFVPLLVAGALFAKNIRATRKVAEGERQEEARLEQGSLLPYNSGKRAWIGKGVTEFDRLMVGGSVLVDRTRIRIEGDRGELLGEAPTAAVSVHSVRIWFGTGIRIELGAHGTWYVQPHYAPSSVATARRATKRLRAAISAAKALQ
jgi:hypothetical protein